MLTDQQKNQYLELLGVKEELAPTFETLDKLTLLHQYTVPFETVTLHRGGMRPCLDIDLIFDKVITRRLGGYCFELNKLFMELLTSLGFNARPVLSRAVRGRDYLMPINHRGMIVHLDDATCSVDVGFGGPMPAGALLLSPDAEQLIHDETFVARKADYAWWKIERLTKAGKDLYDDNVPVRRQVELELCSARVEEIDFDALNAMTASPGTLFRDHEICNRRVPGGYCSLMDNKLTIRQGGEKRVIELPDAAAVDAALAEYFGMTGISDWIETERARRAALEA